MVHAFCLSLPSFCQAWPLHVTSFAAPADAADADDEDVEELGAGWLEDNKPPPPPPPPLPQLTHLPADDIVALTGGGGSSSGGEISAECVAPLLSFLTVPRTL